MTLRIPILPQDAAAALAARGGGPDAATYLYANFLRHGAYEAADYISHNGFALPPRAPAAPASDEPTYVAPPPSDSPAGNEGNTAEDASPILLAENTVGKNTRTDAVAGMSNGSREHLDLKESDFIGEGQQVNAAANGAQDKKPDEGLNLKLAPPPERLKLGANERYRKYIELAASRTGLPPSTIAAVIGAEAGPLSRAAAEKEAIEHFAGPDANPSPQELAQLKKNPEWKKVLNEKQQVWDPKSQASTGGARGLTQFEPPTWIQEAQLPGTYLNEQAKKLKLVDEKNRVLDKDAVLQLRDDPELSIVAAAEYDKRLFNNLAKAKLADNKTPLIPADMSNDQKAYYLYLGHHEGGAERFLRGTMSEATAKSYLRGNALRKDDPDRETKLEQLIAESGGSAMQAYSKFLTDYATRRIVPGRYRE